MDAEALLTLISELYGSLARVKAEVIELRAALKTQIPPPGDTAMSRMTDSSASGATAP